MSVRFFIYLIYTPSVLSTQLCSTNQREIHAQPEMMSYIFLVGLLLLSKLSEGFSFGWGKDPEQSKHLIDLTDDSIESTFEKARYTLIYFYEDNCQYCAHFRPTFEFASTILNNVTSDNTPDIQLVRANGYTNKRLNRLFTVRHYPTLKLLNYETMEITTYTARERNLVTIVDFLEKTMQQKLYLNYDNLESSITVLDNSSVDEFLQEPTASVVVFVMKYLPDWANYKLSDHFYQEIAKANKNIRFALVDLTDFASNKLLKEYEISNFPSMIYFSPKGPFKTFKTHSQNRLTNGKLTESEIEEFLENLNIDEQGKWFKNTDELHALLEKESTYDGHKNVPIYGISFKHSELENNEDIEEEYNSLMEHNEL